MTDLAPAPLYRDVALGPDGGQAWWLTASDGVRLRLGFWPLAGARGTVLMFPGRTEYIEKYGQLARDFHAAGYAMSAMDWRGQGLADRALTPRDIGHVGAFSEFQLDVIAMADALDEIGAPRPWHLLAHSMGGAIGLRALHQALDVERVVFSAPMWRIALSWTNRIAANLLQYISQPLGLDHRFTPTTGPAQPGVFANNRLTTDRAQFEYMEHQVARYPELALGGPSTRWMIEALRETSDLMEMPAPARPALTFLGNGERIVSKPAIRNRMANWPGGQLVILDGAEHEVLMEAPAIRAKVMAATLEWFAKD